MLKNSIKKLSNFELIQESENMFRLSGCVSVRGPKCRRKWMHYIAYSDSYVFIKTVYDVKYP